MRSSPLNAPSPMPSATRLLRPFQALSSVFFAVRGPILFVERKLIMRRCNQAM